MANELWKAISGYEGLYEVSNLGNVRSLFRYKKVLKPWDIGTGYLMVSLSKDKSRRTFFVHRLVASAFIENPENKPQVNHLDENRANNNVSNLEWCTCKENHNYGSHNEKLSTAHINHPKKSKPVAQYTIHGEFICEFPSIADAARKTATNKSDICACCQGKRKAHKGYVWRYA